MRPMARIAGLRPRRRVHVAASTSVSTSIFVKPRPSMPSIQTDNHRRGQIERKLEKKPEMTGRSFAVIEKAAIPMRD
jgi:hypothetical protein